MKAPSHISSVILSTLAAAASFSAAAYDTRAFTFDSTPASNADSQHSDIRISAENAKLLMSRRLGWSKYTQLRGDVDENLITTLNTFEGRQPSLFDTEFESSNEPAKLLVLWEGVHALNARSVAEKASGSLDIRNVANHFLDETEVSNIFFGDESHFCSYRFGSDDDLQGLLTVPVKNERCPDYESIISKRASKAKLSIDDIFNVASSALTQFDGSNRSGVLRLSSKIGVDTKTIASAFRNLEYFTRQNPKQESTLVFIRHSTPLHGADSAKVQARDIHDLTEQPLSGKPGDDIAPPKPSSPGSSPKATHLPSLFPACYPSNAMCEETTNRCSGHGHCFRKHASKDGSSTADCFACKCTKTVLTRYEDGRPKKTIQWGGPACDKKDVSTPFFILVSLTVLVIVFVTGGIRLLYGIGSEDLPSVLGAGVAVKGQK